MLLSPIDSVRQSANDGYFMYFLPTNFILLPYLLCKIQVSAKGGILDGFEHDNARVGFH